MTRKTPTTERQRPPTRQERKAALEATIEQQRIDTLVAAEQWHQAIGPLESGWHTLHRYRKPLWLGGGLVLTLVLRKPGKALRLANRVTVSALALKRLGRILS
ncbi:YqjK-like family protein [Halomonas sp. 18H]|uniref:YqjK-like family protein n=1 Tax=Halomonas almeriensis TaxID=308163 RepID=UPI00222FE0A9|nr:MULTISPECIES: YqjK-like family protein [Halomonas]MCW4150993.1 YqjK-like family protein [Halomonas sp. 18H]MDN3552869.1 YqjK-like family protein [Halomonas almeriensis]